MAKDAYIQGTKEQILANLITTAQPGSPVHEQMKMAIHVYSINDLVKSIDALHESVTKSTESSDKLGTKVFWLNIVIAIATVSGVVIALLEYIKKFS